MFLNKKQDKAATLLNEFIAVNSDKAFSRFKDELIAKHKISKEEFLNHYFAFSLFVVDYSCTTYFNDEIKTSKFLEKFYGQLFLKLNNIKVYEKLFTVINIYAKCVRESKSMDELIQKITFTFSRQLIGEIDIWISTLIGIEFLEIGKITREMLEKYKLL